MISKILTKKWHKGRVIKGKGRGRRLGFPTINLKLKTANFKKGVYFCLVKINKKKHQGLFYFGPRPTFQERKAVVEIHLLSFISKIESNTVIYFKLLKYLRKTKKFKTPQGLKKQISQDIKNISLFKVS